jgi:hypothetical protein
LPGIAIDDLSADQILDGAEDFSAAHIGLHQADLLHGLFDTALLDFCAFLEEVFVGAAETQDVEVAVFGQAPQEDLKCSFGVVYSYPSHGATSIEEEDVLSFDSIKAHLKGLLSFCIVNG